MRRVIIAGGREFKDYDMLEHEMMVLMPLDNRNTTIVSGGARGADTLGERLAERHNLPLEVWPAEWERFGKSAGYRRNEQMARVADCLVAFWDGKSRGTKHMIDIALREGLEVHVYRYV